MKRAAESGLAEIRASKLALEKTQSDAVRQFAQRMVDDHQKAGDKLESLAKDKRVQMPQEPGSSQKNKIAALEKASEGEQFDNLYMSEFGVPAHRTAIALFEQEISQGKDQDLVGFARATLPTLKEHLQLAQDVQATVRKGHIDTAAAGATTMGAGAAASGAISKPYSDRQDDLKQVQKELDEAAQAVQKMKADPELHQEMKKAKGIFVLPDYGRGALGVGAQGGQGVFAARQPDGSFGNPVFYNMGGLSIGLQAGGSAGQVAFLLMTDKAVNAFKSDRNFSLNADAGLTIGSWSERKQGSAGKVQDVVVWSNTKGAYGGASVAVTDVTFDEQANKLWYGKDKLKASEILDGRVKPKGKNANPLGKALAG